ncbi:hypothetical protein HZB69_02315 [Candidatus Amesbacteria bacterium]|nr:hypothetical protein [Candidatus Amesbacteria bacterium]
MKTLDFKKQLIGLSISELSIKAKAIYSQIAQNKLELTTGKLVNKRAVFNLRKQLAVIKTKIYENSHR